MREWEFVGLVREFFTVHDALCRVFDGFRSGSLCFDEVANLVGDTDRSLLFRLKERCHALFRAREPADGHSPREALFDLSVGSLFHEAMKLRENLYQQEIYAPRVERLLGQARVETSDLFVEFERVQNAGADRTLEAMREAELLLDQTRNQLSVLLADFPENGLMARFLVEHAEQVRKVLGIGIDDLLQNVYGSTVQGYRVAIHSYLRSAYYNEALHCLDLVESQHDASDEFPGLRHYSNAMAMFLAGRYCESLDSLDAWVGANPGDDEQDHITSACLVVSRLQHMVPAGDEEGIVARAAKLVKDLQLLLPEAEDS